MIKVREVTFKNSILIPAILKLIDEGHTVTLPLKGFSMRPFLEDGRDKALLTKVGELHVGDPILAMVNNEHYVLHRIVKIEGGNMTPSATVTSIPSTARQRMPRHLSSASTARDAPPSTPSLAASGRPTPPSG